MTSENDTVKSGEPIYHYNIAVEGRASTGLSCSKNGFKGGLQRRKHNQWFDSLPDVSSTLITDPEADLKCWADKSSETALLLDTSLVM